MWQNRHDEDKKDETNEAREETRYRRYRRTGEQENRRTGEQENRRTGETEETGGEVTGDRGKRRDERPRDEGTSQERDEKSWKDGKHGERWRQSERLGDDEVRDKTVRSVAWEDEMTDSEQDETREKDKTGNSVR
jgi:hypothetical protein